MEGGRKVGGRRESSWRREIVRIRDGVGVLAGGWFEKCILKKVGDVSDTLFCSDPWLDGGLCVRGKTLQWETEGGAWVWQRQLWAWEEEMLGECQTLLLDVSLQAQSSDR
ncbi:hypothetical protein TSUD_189270 [Trifolium subterraneum]|uniref:Uncharacterized protein n=1 Tax=Trifolium subterraneum TaxID=3900 RepID=A0A2Z6LQM5_TRISU|nr:hypothetical protein TSUD_189270 [Trifolium subterraneum]